PSGSRPSPSCRRLPWKEPPPFAASGSWPPTSRPSSVRSSTHPSSKQCQKCRRKSRRRHLLPSLRKTALHQRRSESLLHSGRASVPVMPPVTELGGCHRGHNCHA